METQEVSDKHIAIFKSQRRDGARAKFIVLTLLLTAILLSYFELKTRYDFNNAINETHIFPVLTGIALFFGLLLLVSKSILFVNPRKLSSAKNNYKKDIFLLIKESNPEIIEYLPGKKINSNEFYASDLFQTQYEDYIGEDLIEASYRDTKIVICELRVSRLFKNIFKGLFVKCNGVTKQVTTPAIFDYRNPFHPLGDIILAADTLHYINDYCTNARSNISISTKNNILYMAFECNKNLFERSDLRCIKSLPKEISTFNAIFEIVKCVVRDLK